MKREPFITNCLIVPTPDSEYLFNTDGEAFLDGYAIIPKDLFEAMGGTDHPAYQEILAKGRISIGSATITQKLKR